jgi:hypothetical protein
VAQDLLDDDEAVEAGEAPLAREPDLRHPARRELFDERVPAETTDRSDRRLFSHRAPTLPIERGREKKRARLVAVALVGAIVLAAPTSGAKPHLPGEFTADGKLHELSKRVKAEKVPLIGAERLARVTAKLKAKAEPVRILHLGDSHVASDYITGMARHGLQKMYGSGGRGFSHPDQAWGYGGRKLERTDKDWVRDRIVDKDRAGLPFGFSGISIESARKGARAIYRVEPEDRLVRVYYQAQPDGGAADVELEGKRIGTLDTKGETASKVFTVEIGKASKPRKLALVAGGEKVRVYGLSFESKTSGVIYDSIGPVGADAKVYLELEPTSFEEHLTAHDPDLVIVMVGGNDALKIRKGWTTLEKVTQDHDGMLRFLRAKLPGADCMLWTPMDAGDREGKAIASKKYLKEVHDMQLEIAAKHGCAVWDMYRAMGGQGSIARWVDAGVINKDLVHPKKRAADLLGSLFVDAWRDAAK